MVSIIRVSRRNQEFIFAVTSVEWWSLIKVPGDFTNSQKRKKLGRFRPLQTPSGISTACERLDLC